MEKTIMPMGTAAWLIKHTSLENKQIAEFCNISIRDIIDLRTGKVQIYPVDPVNYTQQLTLEDIKQSMEDKNRKLEGCRNNEEIFSSIMKDKKIEKPYLPSRIRKEKKIGVLTILRIHPTISDSDIGKLMNVTKKTVNQYRCNLEELIKDLDIPTSVDQYVSLNPYWRIMREKYNIS